jgi:LuxR family transcriptional regulator, maltose regulon positive regulatory protein
MSLPILATKLYLPAPRPGIVARPRLVERLNAGLQGIPGLTLISAPAGFGKTTLASEWIAVCRRRVAWLSLDEGDNDPARFLTYLITALQTIAPDTGAGLLTLLQSPQPPPIESILTHLLNEITKIETAFILALDDYHVIDSPRVDGVLAFLVEHLTPQLRLVIASREDPTLPLAKLRARGQLTELRAADLRFTPAEAAEFLNRVMGLSLSAEDIAALEARTEGWIAGLQMAALSMQGLADASHFIQSFTGSHRFILDYLLEEVLQRQPVETQAFLLRTSILERLCGPLCDAVTGTPGGCGEETLAAIERANLFIVPLDQERLWYRYHHLFGDLLRQRLGKSLSAGEIAGLHIRASGWYEVNGLPFEAFRHAALAGDVERAERLLGSREIGLHLYSVAMPVLEWLAALPKAVLDARPRLWVRSATVALMMGQTEGVEEKLQAAEQALKDVELDEEIRDLIGQVACARATLGLFRYDTATMISQAQRALAYLRPDNLSYRFSSTWALASAYLFRGERADAARACQEGLAISQKSGDVFSKILATFTLGQLQQLDNQLHQAYETYLQVQELSGEHPRPSSSEAELSLARIHYQWNQLDAAEQHGQLSLQLARLYERVIDRFALSEVFLARLKLARGDVNGAAAMLAGTEQTVRAQNLKLRLPEVAAAQVLVLIRQGEITSAARLAEAFDLPTAKARVHLAQGDPAAALALLEPLRLQLEARGLQDERLGVMVLQALALQALGEQSTARSQEGGLETRLNTGDISIKERAAQVIAEALALAEPGGFVRLFVDEGAPMAQLLRESAVRGVMPGYTARLLAAFAADGQPAQAGPAEVPAASSARKPAQPPAQALIEPLSEREVKILQLIAQGLSNQAISERLFLALSTVKGHNRIIFDKLQVQSRTEAVARARNLGLI